MSHTRQIASPLSQATAAKSWLALLLFLLVMGLAWGVAYVPVHARFGVAGLWQTTISWLLVVAGSMLALGISAWFAGTPHASVANLAGLLPRMFLPLAGLVGLQSQGDWKAAGGGELLLVYYLVALVTDIALVVRLFAPLPEGRAGASPAAETGAAQA
jgi:hypothetical protein